MFFIVAIVLYLPGIWWGLPYATAPDRFKPWGPDELAPLGPIAELYSVFVSPDPKWHGFSFNPQYPLFHYIVQALTVGPYVLFLWLTGRLSQPSVTYPYGLSDPVAALADMTLLARSVNLLMAAAVVVIAYRTATILWDRRTGVITGVLVLLTYPMFYYARTSNVDMGALFWTSLGLAVFAACLRDSLTPRRSVWLGIFAALATATKDASYAAFLMLLLVLVPRHLRQQRQNGVGWRQAWRAPLVGLLFGLAAYVVASGFLFHPGRYLSHLSYIVRGSRQYPVYYSTPATPHGYVSLAGETVGHIMDALGAPIAAFALVGLVMCLFRVPETLGLALPALGIWLGVIIPVRFVMFRFVIIMAYALAFFAAYALSAALSVRRPAFHRAAQLCLVIVCGWSFVRGADLTYQMIYDSRYEAADWLRRNARSGDRIGYYDHPFKLPPLNSEVVTAPMPGQLISSRVWPPHQVAPEFIMVIPIQPFESSDEWALPDDTYQALRDGSLGYQQILGLQTRSLFSRRPVTFVNPPVKVFVRKDHLARLADKHPMIEIDY